MTDWGGGIGHFSQPFDFSGFPPATKWLVTADEKFSKVLSTHTIKFGATYQYTTNNQLSDGPEQGSAIFTNWGGNTTQNAYADMLLGKLGSYSESTANFMGEMAWKEFDVWAQDSWKVSPRLTLDLGIRFQHLGFPYEKNGNLFGFDVSKYNASTPANEFPELMAAYKGDDVPMSIYKTPFVKPAPRLGWAYDLTGKGNTVVRGGVGVYYYREEGNVQFGAIKNPPLLRNVNFGWNPGSLRDMDSINPETKRSEVLADRPRSEQRPHAGHLQLELHDFPEAAGQDGIRGVLCRQHQPAPGRRLQRRQLVEPERRSDGSAVYPRHDYPAPERGPG